jgi:Flp pilus assembly protein TadD
MKKAIVIKFACSAALLGTVAVGCKPASHPASLSSVAPRTGVQAAKLAGKATKALAAKDNSRAVKFAEDAVALAPREAGHRVLLGRAYIAAGRFVSAEAALTDALALNPADGQAELSLALTRIALGKWDQARDMLVAAKGRVGESDRGLALALAGDKAGGVEALEAAARMEGADAKARQNLALGYALSGRWAEAASVAAQDLSPALVKTRMGEWAQLTQPKDAWDQVAALLHVTPVEDGGMPAVLALAPAQPTAEPVAVATVVRVELPTPTPEIAPVVAVAGVTPETGAAPDAARVAEADVPAMASQAPATPTPIPYLMQAAAATPPPLIAARKTPARLVLARTVAKPAFRQSDAGRFVVQLGAFSSPAQVEDAWRKTSRKVSSLAALSPYSATFGRQKIGTVYRLSLAGFETRGAAVNLCLQIRAAKGECFVRTVAGDLLARWDRPKGVRLASR